MNFLVQVSKKVQLEFTNCDVRTVGYHLTCNLTQLCCHILRSKYLEIWELRFDCIDVRQVTVIIVQVGKHESNYIF